MMRRRQRRAFTLIEAIGAIVLLTIAVPPMLWAIREAHIQRIDPVRVSRARWLVTDKMEQIAADRHSSTRGYGYLIESNYPDETTIAGAPGFVRAVTIVETGPDLVTPGTGYKSITVGVSWIDSRGTARSLTVSTVHTDY